MIRKTAAILFLLSGWTAPVSAVTYDGETYRDPFMREKIAGAGEQSEKLAVQAVESLNLDGIAWSPRFAQAIINGQMVEVGSKIANAEVLAIGKDEVKLKFKGKEIVLKEKGN